MTVPPPADSNPEMAALPSAPVPLLPPVSVVVPIYNGEADLPALIERLLAQTYPADQVEYLLVDNGSQDRTPQMLQTAVQQATEKGLRLLALNHTTVQSSYAARNEGIGAATGEIIAFTDADCYPAPDWLVQLVQPFKDANVGLVAGAIAPLPAQNWLERYSDRQQTLSQTSTLNHSFRPYGQTANLAVRAELFQRVGLFRPHLTTGGDADLCWRIQQQTTAQIAYADQAVVLHHHRDTLSGLRRQWYRYGCSNRYLHDLHDIALTRELTRKEVTYRLSRWLLKEIPLATLRGLKGQGNWLDLVTTPLDLLCRASRNRGQIEASLPEEASHIPKLERQQRYKKER